MIAERMLIKEYRIPLPLTVEEYRIAQRYMIQKKSREESEGSDSGVQFVINEASRLEDGRACQYTKKYFFVMRHIPSWLKSVLPSSVLSVLRLTEEAWNAYPYTRTKFYSEALTKLNVHVETVYLPDCGSQHNVFNLKPEELRRRVVDLIDVVNDPATDPAEYVESEDLSKYHSQKTGRGPLALNWLREYQQNDENKENQNQKDKPIMCAYKIMKVDCQYWGFQTKVENFLHDQSRKVMLRSHKQAFAWTDEWHDLSMDDVLALEYETQKILAEKFQTTSPDAATTTTTAVKPTSKSASPSPSSAPSTPTHKRKSLIHQTSQKNSPVNNNNNNNNAAAAATSISHQHASAQVPTNFYAVSSPQRSASSLALSSILLSSTSTTSSAVPPVTLPNVPKKLNFVSTGAAAAAGGGNNNLGTPMAVGAERVLASPSGSAHSIIDQCLRRDNVHSGGANGGGEEDVFYDAFDYTFESHSNTGADASSNESSSRNSSTAARAAGELQRCNSLELAQRAVVTGAEQLQERAVVGWSTAKRGSTNSLDTAGGEFDDDDDTMSAAGAASATEAERQHVAATSNGVGLHAEFPRCELLILLFHGGCLLERGARAAPGIPEPSSNNSAEQPTTTASTSVSGDAAASTRSPAAALGRTLSYSMCAPNVNVYGDAQARRLDFSSFRSTLDSVLTTYYPTLKNKVAVRMVPCPAVCAPFVKLLSALSPYAHATTAMPTTTVAAAAATVASSTASSAAAAAAAARRGDDIRRGFARNAYAESQKNIEFSHLSALPLFAMQNEEYRNKIGLVIETANRVYQEFIDSPHGVDFDGKVIIVGDSCGALLSYDTLCSSLKFKLMAAHAKSPGVVSIDSAASQPGGGGGGSSSEAPSSAHSAPAAVVTGGAADTAAAAGRTSKSPQIFRYTTTVVADDLSIDSQQLKQTMLQQRSVSPLSTPQAQRKALQQQQLLTTPPIGTLQSSHRSSSDSRLGFASARASPPSPLSASASGIEGTFMPRDYLLFDVEDLFCFGAPLGLVLAHRLSTNFYHDAEHHHHHLGGDGRSSLLLSRLNSNCQLYNIFYAADPNATRVEPLVFPTFSFVAPGALPRYERFPLGDGTSQQMFDVMYANREHFFTATTTATPAAKKQVPIAYNKQSSMSALSQNSGTSSSSSSGITNNNVSNDYAVAAESTIVRNLRKCWCGTKRLDYVVYCPDRLQQMPQHALPFLFHASYWESHDVVAFILRQMFVPAFAESMEMSTAAGSEKVAQFSIGAGHLKKGAAGNRAAPVNNAATSAAALLMKFATTMPVERWQKRTTYLKIRNMSPNHRANDVVATEKSEQILQARFAYGMLDMAWLTGEKIDIFILLDRARHRRKSAGHSSLASAPAGGGGGGGGSAAVAAAAVGGDDRNWQLIATETTDKYGRIRHVLEQDKKLTLGQYPVRFVVRGDHTFTECSMAIMPMGTELIVFSIDGSFTASMSVSGRDPKVRPGAVDVVRHWQSLGYLILYISGRPLMQRRNISAWLAQHNFPFGLFHFTDGVAYDPLGQKRDYLLWLQQHAGLLVHGAYGSAKDVAVYGSANVASEKIYVVGKLSKKRANAAERAVLLRDGYAAHLSQLLKPEGSRPAQGNGRLYVNKGVLPLPADAYVLSSSSGIGSHNAAGARGEAGASSYSTLPASSSVTKLLSKSFLPASLAASGGATATATTPLASPTSAAARAVGRLQRVKHHIVRYHSMRHGATTAASVTILSGGSEEEKSVGTTLPQQHRALQQLTSPSSVATMGNSVEAAAAAARDPGAASSTLQKQSR